MDVNIQENNTLLFIIDNLRRGGKERQFIELIKGLKDSSLNISVLVFDRNISFDLPNAKNIDYYIIEEESLALFIIKVTKLIYKLNPSIVFSWSLRGAASTILQTKFKGGKFIYGALRNTKPIHEQPKVKIQKFLIKYSDAVISNSYTGLAQWGLKEDLKKFYCLYNGIDLDRFKNLKYSNNDIRKKLNINTKYVIGMVARFSESKDYGTFFNVAEIMCKESNDFTFVAIGTGPTFYYYYNKFNDTFNGRIKLIGEVNNIEDYLNILTIGVLISFREGISNSILEYMAAKVPVIATGCGGTKEIIHNNHNGIHLIEWNEEKICQSINRLINNLEERKHFIEQAYVVLNEKFSLQTMLNKFFLVLKNLESNAKK